MKTSLKNNKKFWAVALAVLVSMSCLFGIWTVVYAQEQKTTQASTKDEAVQTEVEVNVKYIFEDEKVFKEEKIKAEKGQLLDSGDLPMLPDDMKFIDDFLFYEVKGDGKDEIIRKVVKVNVKDKETQTENGSSKSDQGSQSNASKTENKGTQTELSKDDISKMEKESKELQEKLDKLNQEIKDKDKLSDKQKEKIKDLEKKIDKLKEKLEKGKDDKDLSADMKKEIDKLTEKIKELEKKTNEVGKATVTHNPTVTPISPISGMKTGTGNFPQTSVSDMGKGSSSQDNIGKITKDTNVGKTDGKEKEVRYPNKLTPKQPANNSSQDSSMDGSSKNVNTNKGAASAPSKARGTVTENKDNANKDYPIHHGDSSDKRETDMYSADARQFVTFTTKNGKTFHLIINHDEDSENVMLLTEVSEDDLLNMVEKKEAPKQEITKEEPEKEEPKPVKKEESSNTGTYLILILVVAGALGAGYYFKVIKKKEDKELEGFEEEDDDFFSEAEESENEVDEAEVEDKEDDELK
ncbi:TPA: CD1107 family mobile element protein [Streptococcus agalactiae]|jgi:putative cell surface protein